MKKESNGIERYADGDWFFIITDDGKTREAWIGHSQYGICEYMFGIPTRQEGRPAMFYRQFLEIVEANAEEYKELFRERYFEEA